MLIDEADVDDAYVCGRRHCGGPGVQRRRRLQGGRRGLRGGVAVEPSPPGATLRAATTPVVCAVNGACVTGASGARGRAARSSWRRSGPASPTPTPASACRRGVGPHRVAPAGGRRPQGGRAVDHRQLRRRRRGAAPRIRSTTSWPTTSSLRFTRALARRHRPDRRGRGRCSTCTGVATDSRWNRRCGSLRPSTP